MRIQVARFNKKNDSSFQNEQFDVSISPGETVLGALQRIYEFKDSSLAFRYGCRFKDCGLCTIKINGKAQMACTTGVEEGMELHPLDHFPVIRDLFIDRRPITNFFLDHQIYLVQSKEDKPAKRINVPKEYQNLTHCTECLACLSECPSFDLNNKHFGGPLTFVKLAQFHYDPRDTIDRKNQAKHLGITTCIACKTKCRCPNGIPIFSAAIKLFL